MTRTTTIYDLTVPNLDRSHALAMALKMDELARYVRNTPGMVTSASELEHDRDRLLATVMP